MERTTPARALTAGGTLVVQTAFLGDALLTSGLLSELAGRFGPVDVLVTPGAVPLLETHPGVRDVLVYDKRGTDRGPRAWWQLVRRVKARQYQRAFLPHRSMRTAALAWAAAIPERVGFGGTLATALYSTKIPWPDAGHYADKLLALSPGTTRRASVELHLTEDDRATAYAWLAARGVGDGFVAMAPGSIWGTKRWPGFPDLARLLPGRVVVLGGADDAELAQRVVDAAPDRVVNATGVFSLRESAAVLERAGVLITNDSAPLHLASATRTATVAIFGPTVPAFGFGPRAPLAAIVERSLPCRPCSDHGPATCPLGHHRCMREIPADTVRDAIQQLIG